MATVLGFPPKKATDKQRKYLRFLHAPRWDDPKLTAEEASELISDYETDALDYDLPEWNDFDD